MKNGKKIILGVVFTLIFSLVGFAQKSAKELLAEASIKAKKENKAILVKFEASWCGWCKNFNNNLKKEDIKKIMEDKYVIVNIVVFEPKEKEHLETKGGRALIKKYTKSMALPFFAFLDKDQKLISKYTGSAVSQVDFSRFTDNLKLSSNITQSEISVLKKTFIVPVRNFYANNPDNPSVPLPHDHDDDEGHDDNETKSKKRGVISVKKLPASQKTSNGIKKYKIDKKDYEKWLEKQKKIKEAKKD